jgi:nucleoside 2-deoxyribosyltransferase
MAILPAVATDCGFDVIRLDRVEHSENINDRILTDIRRAQFIVADFTFHPPGVYFEAGFALGLGKLVIWKPHDSLGKSGEPNVRQLEPDRRMAQAARSAPARSLSGTSTSVPLYLRAPPTQSA